MSDRETKLEMAELNRDLAELWLDELDLYELHMSQPSLKVENRCVRAHNSLHRQLDKCKTILHGERLRKVFGYE